MNLRWQTSPEIQSSCLGNSCLQLAKFRSPLNDRLCGAKWIALVYIQLYALTQYKIDNWQTEQGLPMNTVQSLLQTRDGYLWVGTAAGLARFDGVRFKTYESLQIPVVSSSPVFGLMEDAQGTLWIGHACGAVIYRDGRFQSAFPNELHGNNNLSKLTALTEKGETVCGRGHPVNTNDILTGSTAEGLVMNSGKDTTCGNWTQSGEGSAIVGHHDRIGTDESAPMKSWNSSHATPRCSPEKLRAVGGGGLLYCFAAD